MFEYIKRLFSGDIAVDLGTANTLIYVKRKGILLNEPSVVVVEKHSRKIVSTGKNAKIMLGKAPDNMEVIRPMKDGVINDFDVTEEMIRLYLEQVLKRRHFVSPRVIVCVPACITEVEKRAVYDATARAGASEIYLISEPMAAAIGVDIQIEKPIGSMVVDIGGGTTDIAVIALGGVACELSIRVAGDEMDEAVVNFMRKKYNLLIGPLTAENVKIAIGSAFPLKEELRMEVRGRDLVDGVPKTIEIRSDEIREAFDEPVHAIIEAIKHALERTPPELAGDIAERGIIMTGGGSLLRNFDKKVSRETGLKVVVANDPLTCVVRGTGKVIDQLPKYEKVLLPNPKR